MEENIHNADNATDDTNDWLDARNPNRTKIQHSFDMFQEHHGLRDEYFAALIDASIIDFYKVFVNDTIIELIVEQTNLYAMQTVLTVDTRPSSRIHDWEPVTADEIWKFLGMVIYMGIVRLPTIADYWSTDPFFKNEIASKIMSRNRFQMILKFIHFSNNEANVDNDRLFKVKELSEKLIANFQSVYKMGPIGVIDESMIPFRGRLSFRQYLKQKAHPYGIKIFKLCSGSGYTHNFRIYSGKVLDRKRSVPEEVVLSLMNDYLDTGRTLVTDNWYTSLNLAQTLLSRKTHLVGTIRKNRKGIPSSIFDAFSEMGSNVKLKLRKKHMKLQKFEVKAMRNREGVTIVHYKEQRNVLLLSTRHSLEMCLLRKTRNLKPDSVLFYNKEKKAVDIADQMAMYQDVLRKSLKWYKKVAFDLLLNMACINSWIIYQEVIGDKIPIVEFRKTLVRALCEIPVYVDRKIDSGKTTVHRLDLVDGKRYKNRRQCRSCYQQLSAEHGAVYARNHAKKVVTFCKNCPNHPFYCIVCFNKRHK